MSKFAEGYVRGGASTLYLSRSDAVQILAYILRQRGALRELLREARDDIRASRNR